MTLPHGTGSRVTICVFAAGADAEIAVKEGEREQCVCQVVGYLVIKDFGSLWLPVG